jgi:hypothetical protein
VYDIPPADDDSAGAFISGMAMVGGDRPAGDEDQGD